MVLKWDSHDAAALSGYFVQDADVITPHGRVIHGRDDIAALLKKQQQQFPKKTTYELTVNTVRFVTPNVVIVDWTGDLTNMVSTSGKPLPPLQHKVTAILVRDSLGQWLISAVRPQDLQPATAGRHGKKHHAG